MWLYTTTIDYEFQNNGAINSRMIPVSLNALGQIVLEPGHGSRRLQFLPQPFDYCRRRQSNPM
jgi:hypothetical protein